MSQPTCSGKSGSWGQVGWRTRLHIISIYHFLKHDSHHHPSFQLINNNTAIVINLPPSLSSSSSSRWCCVIYINVSDIYWSVRPWLQREGALGDHNPKMAQNHPQSSEHLPYYHHHQHQHQHQRKDGFKRWMVHISQKQNSKLTKTDFTSFKSKARKRSHVLHTVNSINVI